MSSKHTVSRAAAKECLRHKVMAVGKLLVLADDVTTKEGRIWSKVYEYDCGSAGLARNAAGFWRAVTEDYPDATREQQLELCVRKARTLFEQSKGAEQ